MKAIAVATASLMLASSGLILAVASPAEAQSRGGSAPRGSYAQSCTNAYVSQGRLYAECRDRQGRERTSSIEVSRCARSDISNDNGLLTCYNQRGQFERDDRDRNDDYRPNRPGQGGYGNDVITVYRDANFRGASMTFRNEVSNLRSSGMNDQISSIRLGRGDWEVCTDAHFRGDCRIIRDDERDLARSNLNDKISSLRPARRGGYR